jgi:hypothetical protein
MGHGMSGAFTTGSTSVTSVVTNSTVEEPRMSRLWCWRMSA